MAPTPGPWTYTKHNWQETSVYAEGIDSPVCTLRLSEDVVTEDNQEAYEGEQESNAKLIAAAHDLARACMMAREELEFGGDWQAAQAVINRALKKAGFD
jgi:hypothetical protein